MPMSVLNNAAAGLTLGELNKNTTKLGKSLRRLATGERIANAGDGPAEYAISEKMRHQIRSLDQCDKNTKYGRNMIEIASGAVGEQLEALKKMREIALKSSDDTYTDKDREVLQAETKELLMEIDDIARGTTYNGKYLLNGITMSKKPEVEGFSFDTFNPSGEPHANTLTLFAPNVRKNGVLPYPNSTELYPSSTSVKLPPGSVTYRTDSSKKYLLDFPALRAADLPNSLKNQGISILCSGCDQYVSIVFDVNARAGQAQDFPSPDPTKRTRAYAIGVKGVKSGRELGAALFSGIKSVNGTINGDPNAVQVTTDHNIRIVKEGNDFYLTKGIGDPDFAFYNGTKGYFGYTEGDGESSRYFYTPYKDFHIQDSTQASMYTNLRFRNTTTDVLFPPENSPLNIEPNEEDYPKEWSQEILNMSDKEKEYYNERYELNGDEEEIRKAKWRDEDWPYPRKGAVATETAVRTKSSAKRFIGDIDNAINYVLDVSTTLGAYSMRLNMSSENLIVNSENTQASESTLRDADMAKEMTNFTKHNILMQSAQAMMSQANQNASGVLGLLQ